MKKNGDGFSVDTRELEITAPTDLGRNNGEHEGKKAILDENSLGGLFSSPQDSNILKELFTPGNSILNLLMRGSQPGKQKNFQGMSIFVVAMSHHIDKAVEFSDSSAVREALLALAGSCGVDEARARLLVNAYTGQMEMKKKGGSIGEKIRKMAGLSEVQE